MIGFNQPERKEVRVTGHQLPAWARFLIRYDMRRKGDPFSEIVPEGRIAAALSSYADVRSGL